MIEHSHIQTEPGSYYIRGSEAPKLRIIFMHGSGSNAVHMEKSAADLAKLLPDAQIVVPNGTYQVPEETMTEEHRMGLNGLAGYRWFKREESPSAKEVNFFKVHLPDIEKQDTEKSPLFLLGFSEGGFYAAQLYAHDPERYSGVVLHSSAIVNSMKNIKKNENPDRSAPAKVYSFIGLQDPYLRMKVSPLLLAIHFKNSVVLNWRGHKSRTGFQWGLAHTITQSSIKRAADHIQKIMDYSPGLK